MRTADQLTDPALSDFAELRAGAFRILVRRGYEAHAAVLGLAGDPDPAGGRVAGGRAEHPLVELPGGERALVRRYHRGGAVRHVNGSTYFIGRRSYHELRVTERARSAGVSVPIILAAAERRRLVGYNAWLASRWIPDARDLAWWLGTAAEAAPETEVDRKGAMKGGGRSLEERRVIEREGIGSADRETGLARAEAPVGEQERLMELVGRQVGVMHGGGIAHPDLNLRNVLVTRSGAGGPAVHLLDFDRGRIYPRPVPTRRRRSDLERFARSARKLGAAVSPAGWKAFRAGYGDEWPEKVSLG